MKVYRLEFDDEGLFDALDYLYGADMDIDDQIDFGKAEADFEGNLATAKYLDLTKTFKFYFTEEGYNRFKDDIEIISNLFEKYVNEIGIVSLSSYTVPDDIYNLYRDEYQIVITNEDMEDIING